MPLLTLTSIPWNTSITVPLTLLVLVICTSSCELSYPWAVALGLAIGWIFGARYADAAFVAIPVIAPRCRSIVP